MKFFNVVVVNEILSHQLDLFNSVVRNAKPPSTLENLYENIIYKKARLKRSGVEVFLHEKDRCIDVRDEDGSELFYVKEIPNEGVDPLTKSGFSKDFIKDNTPKILPDNL